MKRTHELLSKLSLPPLSKDQLLQRSLQQEKLKDRPPYKNIMQAVGSFSQTVPTAKHSEIMIDQQAPSFQGPIISEYKESIMKTARELIPWKKGPFKIDDVIIDAEWRSDLKWQRIAPFIHNLAAKKVLDIGCNNGYFMYRLLEKNPQLVLGIDPVVPNWAQFSFLHHLNPDPRLFFELWGVEDLHLFNQSFDLILSMGIIYHHRNPIEQLIECRHALTPGGQLIIETIAIPGEESHALFVEDRYAKMRNVWFVPTTTCLINWLKKARFYDIQLICESELNDSEQRLTPWCPPPRQSLNDFLDPNDQNLTIEGYPAPIRVALSAKRHPDDKQS